MAHPLSFLCGAGVGAGAMFFLDPDRGNRRRSLLTDQFVHCCSQTQKAADVVRRDSANRLYGLFAEIRSAFQPDDASDETLVQRVRAKIGHCVSHPAAISVTARDGCVTLSGPVLADEVQYLISRVRCVRGVDRVENALDIHNEPGNISALQGEAMRSEQFGALQQNWSPTTQAAVGAAGLGLVAALLGGRSTAGLLLGTVGLGLAAATVVNNDGMRSRGARRGGNQLRGAASEQHDRNLPNRRSSEARLDQPAMGGSWNQGQPETQSTQATHQRSQTQSSEPAVHDL